MSPDTYPSFRALAAAEVKGRDFSISIQDTGSPILVAAPHGGRIEPGTSAVCRLIAGSDLNFYLFEGKKSSGNSRLHLTSHRFDEPDGLALARRSSLVITVHACRGTAPDIRVGGLDTRLGKSIIQALSRRGIPAGPARGRLRGIRPENLCNQGFSRRGVQLEISRGLRDDVKSHGRIAEAVREAIADCEAIRQQQGDSAPTPPQNPVDSFEDRPSHQTCQNPALAPLTRRIIRLIRAIPEGAVSTYGRIATLAGSPRSARQVARILHSSSEKYDLPWHRVVNRQGRISLNQHQGFEIQRQLLIDEGVRVDAGGTIDLDRFEWRPDIPPTTGIPGP